METEFTVTGPISLAEEETNARISLAAIGTSYCLISSDLVIFVFSLICSFLIRDIVVGGFPSSIVGVVVPAVLLVLGGMVAAGPYPAVCENPVEELRRSFFAITPHFHLTQVVSFSARHVAVATCSSLWLDAEHCPCSFQPFPRSHALPLPQPWWRPWLFWEQAVRASFLLEALTATLAIRCGARGGS